MIIIQIVSIGIIASILAVILKKQVPEISIIISIVTGVIILYIVIGNIEAVINIFNDISKNIDIDNFYFEIILKIIGIAYICEFGVQVCKDAGENAIATKIELAGKILIMSVSVPIIVSLMELVMTMLYRG